jgi:hypothetical protein
VRRATGGPLAHGMTTPSGVYLGLVAPDRVSEPAIGVRLSSSLSTQPRTAHLPRFRGFSPPRRSDGDRKPSQGRSLYLGPPVTRADDDPSRSDGDWGPQCSTPPNKMLPGVNDSLSCPTGGWHAQRTPRRHLRLAPLHRSRNHWCRIRPGPATSSNYGEPPSGNMPRAAASRTASPCERRWIGSATSTRRWSKRH